LTIDPSWQGHDLPAGLGYIRLARLWACQPYEVRFVIGLKDNFLADRLSEWGVIERSVAWVHLVIHRGLACILLYLRVLVIRQSAQ
jgi:hypothetical protein